MPYLLHIDSSALPHRSVSRDVAATFPSARQKENPERGLLGERLGTPAGHDDLGVHLDAQTAGFRVTDDVSEGEDRRPGARP